MRKLIAGPKVYICDECIDLCNDILLEEEKAKPTHSTQQTVPQRKLEADPVTEQPTWWSLNRWVWKRSDSPPDRSDVNQPAVETELRACGLCGEPVPLADIFLIRDRWVMCPTCIEAVRALILGETTEEASNAWLAQAEDDLAAAQTMAVSGDWGHVLFFCHEVVEKALKGFLAASRMSHSRATHSVFTLLKRASEVDQRFRRFGPETWSLDTCYYLTRYPVGEPPKRAKEFFNNPEEGKAAIRAAETVLTLCREVVLAFLQKKPLT